MRTLATHTASAMVRRICAAALAVAVLLGAAFAAAAPPPVGTSIVNTATVQFSDSNGNLQTRQSNTVQTLISGIPILSVDITPGSSPAGIGQDLSFTIAYANNGNLDAADTTLAVTLSEHVHFVSAPAGCTYTPEPPAGGSVACALGNLAAAAQGSLQISTRVKSVNDYPSGPPIAIGTVITTSAMIQSGTHSASDMADVPVGNSPNLTLTKSASLDTVGPGGVMTYTIHYQNTGNAPATGVTIRDELPTGTTLVPGSVSAPGAAEDGAVVWALGQAPAGAQGQVQFSVTVSQQAAQGSQISNQASLSSAELADVLSNQTTATVQNITFTIQDTPDPVRAGRDITYTLTLVNNMFADTGAVTVSGPIPPGTTFANAGQGVAFADGTVTWNLDSLPLGAQITLNLTLTTAPDLADAQTVTFDATATSPGLFVRSASAATTVAGRTAGTITFQDANAQPVLSYSIGGAVCVLVTDADRDLDPGAADVVSATLKHKTTGDTEIVMLTETGASTGAFRGCLQSGNGPAAADDSRISLSPDSSITATYTDPQDAVPDVTSTALVDPLGIVFDSHTGDPVAGALVTLVDNATGRPANLPQPPEVSANQPNPATTDQDGAFTFPFVPAGNYTLRVDPGAGYTFPSTVPDAALPAQYQVDAGSRGESFAVSTPHTPLNLDIPVDAAVVRSLVVSKSGSRDVATAGDSVSYAVTITNQSSLPVTSLSLVDVLPHGVVYVPGSSRLDGGLLADPQPSGVRTMIWQVADSIDPGKSRTVTYTAVVGPDSENGDGRNTAQARGVLNGETIFSNRASHVIKVREGVFTRNGTIVGSVFVDTNGNGVRNAGEPGVEDAILFLEDGTWIRTGFDGRFSLNAVPPGSHVMRLDDASIPNTLAPSPTGNRFTGSSRSQFVDLSPSGLANADFALAPVDAGGRAALSFEGTDQQLALILTPDQVETQGDLAPEPKPEPVTLEKQLLGLPGGLEILFPAQGAVLDNSQTSIRVKSPLDTRPELLVNGAPVPADRIGKTVRNPIDGTSGYEYIGVKLAPGADNEIRAVLKDANGQILEQNAVTVSVVGAPAALAMTPDRAQAPANGTSVIKIQVVASDAAGRRVQNAGFVTIETTAGDILEKDADPATFGFQIAFHGGEAAFTLRAPLETRDAIITARAGGLDQTVTVTFTPNLRNRFAVGYADLVLGSSRSGGATAYLDDNGTLDQGTYMNSHTAFFMKKAIGKNTLLTTSFNSNRSVGHDMFRSTDKQHDAEAYYPLYGDASESGFNALSRSQFYFKLERGGSSLLYGDYETDFSDTLLANYTRTFNGFHADVGGGAFRLKSFVSSTTQTQAVDTLRGNGTAGYYHLTRKPVLEGSDRVTVEVRDRLNIDRVIQRTVRTRWIDYTMDYEIGAILFKEPVPGRDRDLNPIFIVVHYETDGGDERFYIYGARGTLSAGRGLTLGFTGVVQEQQVANTRLIGLDARYALGKSLSLKAEAAMTQSLIDNGSGPALQDGGAWAFELDYLPSDRTTFSAYARKSSLAFDNPSSANLLRGETRAGFNLRHALTPSLSLISEYQDYSDRLNHTANRFGLVGLEKKTAGGLFSLEYIHSVGTNRYVPPASLTSRAPLENSDDALGDTTALRVSVRRDVSPSLSVTARHQQDFDNRNNRSSLGIDFKVSAMTRMYVAVERDTFPDREDIRTVLGVDARVSDSTTAYNEYRMENGTDGSSVQQVIGLKNKFVVRKGFTGSLALENLQTRSGVERDSESDGFALSLGLEYVPDDKFSLTTRFERRTAGSDDTLFAEGGLNWIFGADSSLLLRKRYYRQNLGDGGQQLRDRMLIGLAHRGGHGSTMDIFAKFIFDNQKNTAQPAAQNEKNRIFSIETLFHINKDMQVTAKYAGKWSDQAGSSTFTQLIATRVLHDLNGRWQVSGDLRLLTSRALGISSYGGSLEFAYTLITNLQLGIGYSFDAFDTDLTGDSYWGKGYYMRLRYKIDQ